MLKNIMITGLFLGNSEQRLTPEEEIELFIKIRDADELSSVVEELSIFYYSVSGTLWGELYKAFKKFIPPRLIEDLENAFQDGWLKILEKRKSFNPQRSKKVFNWMFQIMKNNTYNIFKRLDRVRDMIEFKAPRLSDYSSLALLEKLVNKLLSDLQKQIFLLYVKNNYTIQEIAKKIGITTEEIRESLNTVADKLRANFDYLVEKTNNEEFLQMLRDAYLEKKKKEEEEFIKNFLQQMEEQVPLKDLHKKYLREQEN